MKVSKEDILKANRKANRELNLVGNFYNNTSTKVFVSKKVYNRKKVILDYI